jgi:lipopolysaccharide export LptBFGC system permease protein LptF
MKINKVFLMVVTTVVVLITFLILWMFHGGADQSKVIIEENVQKDNKVSSVQKNYSELSMSSNANILINQNNKPIEHDMNNVLVKDKDYANYSYNQETPVFVLGVNEANLPPFTLLVIA